MANIIFEKKYKDISTMVNFEKFGDIFKQIKYNPQTNLYIYERCHKDGTARNYEVVQGVKVTNDDGNVVYKYPDSSNWGIYGLTFMTLKQCEYAFNNGIYEFLHRTNKKQI